MKGVIVVDVPQNCSKCSMLSENHGCLLCGDKKADGKFLKPGSIRVHWCPIIETGDVAAVNYGTWFDRGSLSCRCSNCGGKNMAETRYCPHCGAKMILAIN